ncbi:MAG: tetratricopeptide repeat protein, partial [Gemmatimonadaceae bacterium]
MFELANSWGDRYRGMLKGGLVSRHVIGIAVLVLGIVAAPIAAQDVRAAADSARRLDSLAATLRVWDRPTRETRARAVRLWTEAAALYRRGGDRRREGDALTQAGRGHSNRDTAAVYLQTALQIAREVGDTAGIGRALLWIRPAGIPFDSMFALRREAARIARQVGNRWGESRAWAFYWLANAHLQLGQRDSAEAYYREAVAVA